MKARSLTFVAVLASFGSCLLPSAKANLIYNPGFDLPGSLASNSNNSLTSATIPGWVLNGLGTVGSNIAQVIPSNSTFGYGDNFGRVVGNSWIMTSSLYRPAVSEGQLLDYSFRLYTASPSIISIDRVFLRWYDSDSQFLSSTNVLPADDQAFPGEEALVSGTATVPNDAASVAYFISSTYSPYRDIYVDDFSLTVVPEPSAYTLLLGLSGLALVNLRRIRPLSKPL